MRTEMDCLVMEDVILYKHQQPVWDESPEWQNEFELD
jgi:carbamoyltransferase